MIVRTEAQYLCRRVALTRRCAADAAVRLTRLSRERVEVDQVVDFGVAVTLDEEGRLNRISDARPRGLGTQCYCFVSGSGEQTLVPHLKRRRGGSQELVGCKRDQCRSITSRFMLVCFGSNVKNTMINECRGQREQREVEQVDLMEAYE